MKNVSLPNVSAHPTSADTDRQALAVNGSERVPAITPGDLAELERTLPPFLDMKDLRELTGCSVTGSYQLAHRIGAVRLGPVKLLRVSRGSVLLFLAEQAGIDDSTPAA